ncbi:Serine carboxypeptidase S28 family protein [Euphorbia peplus]|nr:Serine carboxypeptidase S28 family protein [Euphorbia peplus]
MPEPMGCGSEFKTYTYKQTLDHFNFKPESYETFQQRYFVNKNFWGGGSDGDPRNSPIFVYFGADESFDIFKPCEVGFMADNAIEFNALLVYIEHRYYGKSIPACGSIDEIMRNADKRGYFNSAQALADYAEIILHIKRSFYAMDSPVIVIGKAYGGMLATWFRLHYPHIATGALASSAAVLSFDNIIPQTAYYSKVTMNFKEASESCYTTIKESWAFIDEIAYQPHGLDLLSRTFRTCKTLTTTVELKKYIEEVYVDAAKHYGDEGSPVHVICQAIDDPKDDCPMPINKIASGLFAYLKHTKHRNSNSRIGECTVNAPIPFDGWGWQTCSEMVMPKSSGSDPDSMFQSSEPFNFQKFSDSCFASYGVTPRPHWITTYYGGHNFETVLSNFGSHIIFSNGLKDPLSSAGVLHSISDTIVSVVTKYGSHGMDLECANEMDPDWLIEQRHTEVTVIHGWLRHYYCQLHPKVIIKNVNGDFKTNNVTRSLIQCNQ